MIGSHVNEFPAMGTLATTAVFSTFLDAFELSDPPQPGDAPGLVANIEPYASGFTELLSARSGASFRNGLYRLHTLPGVLQWTAIAEEALPRYPDQTMGGRASFDVSR